MLRNQTLHSAERHQTGSVRKPLLLGPESYFGLASDGHPPTLLFASSTCAMSEAFASLRSWRFVYLTPNAFSRRTFIEKGTGADSAAAARSPKEAASVSPYYRRFYLTEP
jgi:hypothetical protein